MIFNEVYLIGKPYNEVEGLLKSIDNAIETDGSGLIPYQFGLGVYATFSEEEPNEPVEGVIIFEKGYYS